ncbi:MAG: glycoside hydrolase family 3 C-terminal domain-containing protein [Bacteroidota bacterium]
MKRIITLLIIISASCSKPSNEFRFQDTSLTFEDRVDDLVGRMTLEEKVSQMMNASPAIERLGIPQYNWWSEGLHGVARAGLATVYPQAIGLGATWDEPMMFDVANAIGDEARAKHHDFVKHNKRFLYQGLTLWSPNINIFRDPRWGRGQETYGEDPYLTGRLAVQFVKGLQGDDPKYFKTIATVKHFAVHSGPEPERHVFDAQVDEKDFRDTYLSQFEMGVKEGKAYSVMCAYNRINGEACCGSDHLLTKILREEWGFNGYIVSDCDAIVDIYKGHKITQTPEEAAALAVKSGCDLECGKVYDALKKAVADKIISEEEINTAVKRLFMARFKLGMFDPDNEVRYAQIPYSTVDSKEHRELALDAARKSIVLLKNDKSTLPLKKDIGTIAVIGPNSDQWLMLLGNYNGVPADPITPLRGIREKVSSKTKVLYAQGSPLADGMPLFETVSADVLSYNGKPGLLVEYFNDHEIGGKQPLYSETSTALDANWKNKAPREDLDDDNFGVRWTGEITPKETGVYQVGIISTCNTKLFMGDTIIAKTVYHFRDEYGDPRLRKSAPIKLEAGKSYKFKVEAGETFADAQVQLVWDLLGKDEITKLKKEAVETAKKSDVVVMFMGLTARLEGEEMDVAIEGFRGGDRTSIDLPKVQQDLIKEIHKLGKPVVLVLLNGSALAINWESKNIPAIVEAWYPGQAAGQAIADVLFGDYNPGGKLPVTFYKSADDLPAFEDYRMKGRTYRFFEGEPLYPFGYGLSYTSFSYKDLKVDGMKVSVNVTNTGKSDGDEVVQVYASGTLAAFKRVHLKAGESTTVDLEMKNLKPGDYSISVGGGQPRYAQNLTTSK